MIQKQVKTPNRKTTDFELSKNNPRLVFFFKDRAVWTLILKLDFSNTIKTKQIYLEATLQVHGKFHLKSTHSTWRRFEKLRCAMFPEIIES